MTVLVTGATGFIGSNLVRKLVGRGQQVRILHRARSKLTALEGLEVERVSGDLLDEESLARAVHGCEMVYHVAARVDYWRASRQELFRVNVGGTQRVMAACWRAGISRVVHTSSISAIGLPPCGTVGTEDTLFDARSAKFAYAESKRLAELEVQKFVARGLPAVIVNPAVVVGEGDYSMHVGRFVREFERGRVLAVPPGGVCIADVEAIVEGEIAAAERGRVGERYIMGGENLTYRQIADTLAAVLGIPAPQWVLKRWAVEPIALAIELVNYLGREPLPLSGEQLRLATERHFFDSGKAMRELNYPLLPFKAAVEKACRWYRENGYLQSRE